MISAIKRNGRIQLISSKIPDRELSENLCTIKVEYCGICGTDYIKFTDQNDVADWGHEILGRVILNNGTFSDPVVIRTSFPCGKCNACLSGQEFKCTNWHRESFNGFSDYITIDKRSIIAIGEGLLDYIYTLSEPLYVALNLVNRISPNTHDRIAILGNGTISLLCAFYLYINGYKNISIYARNWSKARKEYCLLRGIHIKCFDELQEEIIDANKIIVTTPYKTMSTVIKAAPAYAIVTFNGINNDSRILIDMSMWHFKNITISPSFPHPQISFEEAIRIIKKYKTELQPIITDVYELSNISNAFEYISTNKEHIKVLIKM